MIPLSLKGCSVSVSWHRQLTRRLTQGWARFLRQGVTCGPWPSVALALLLQNLAHLNTPRFSNTSVLDQSFCLQRIEDWSSGPLWGRMCSAWRSVSLSGSQIVPIPAYCGQDIGSIIGSWAHNEPLRRSLQWTVHYRWQTEQSEWRMLNNNAYWGPDCVTTNWKQTSS